MTSFWKNPRPFATFATACALLLAAGGVASARRFQSSASSKKDVSESKEKSKTKPSSSSAAKDQGDEGSSADETRREADKAPDLPTDPDTYLDPVAKNLLANDRPELFRSDLILSDQFGRAVLTMANGTANPDKATIVRFIHHEAAQLTSRKNIDALLAPPGTRPKGSDPLAIGQAGVELMEPLRGAAKVNNQSFRRDYVAALLAPDVMPRLLAGHLFTRTQAMLVLSKSEDPQALETFVKALKDSNQPISVKILAAKGISNVTRQGRRPLDGNKGFPIAQAVVSFLENDAKRYWPAKIASLEAIGSLRLSTVNLNNADFEISVAAAKLLENPNERPDVRAWAAWAIGMTRIVGPQADKFNFILVANDMGRLAVSLAESILTASLASRNAKEKNKPPAELADDLTALLYYRVFRGLSREPDLNDSGLVNSPGIPQRDRGAIRDIESAVRNVTVAAVELSRAAGSQIPERQKALRSKISLLKKVLEQSPPSKRTLVNNNP